MAIKTIMAIMKNPQTPADAYSRAAVEIGEQVKALSNISQRLHDVNPARIHWGHVGDLERLRTMLAEVLAITKNKGQMMNSKPAPQICWYTRRHELEPGQVFRLMDGSHVKLDRRVEGDGTKWEVADWCGDPTGQVGHWSYEGGEIEPGDLSGDPIADDMSAINKATGQTQ